VRSCNSVKRTLACAFILNLAIGLLSAGSAFSNDYTYGDYAGSNLEFLDVAEASATSVVPVFGAPTVSGDSLLFAPENAEASSSSGGTDFLDGQLTTTIRANAGYGINQLSISEAGNYSLSGAGAAATEVSAGLASTLSILEINGTALSIPIIVSQNADAYFNLAASGGEDLPWSLSVLFDIDDVLADNELSGMATLVTLTFDNTLGAVSEAGSEASIAKDSVVIGVVASPVPEPSAIVLLGVAVLAIAGRSVWRKRAKANLAA